MGNSKSSGSKGKSSSVQDFRYVNGRRYHCELDTSYILSSDIEEIDRQQLQHYCCKHIFKCNVSAPVERMLIEGSKVLDVGCGTGIWVLELSTEYIKSEFTGVDMSPVFPTQIKPLNSTFCKANVLHGLPFPSDEFDYVHLSFMNGCFTDDQWQNIVIPELIRVLKPGGWLELYDVDVFTYNGGPLINRLTASVQQRISSVGLNSRAPNLYKPWVSSHSCFSDVEEIAFYPYIGEWKDNVVDGEDGNMELNGKENIKSRYDVGLGILLKEMFKIFYISESENLSQFAGISKEEYLEMVEECFEQEMLEYDSRVKFMRVIGRKDVVEI
ncbi:13322_t:CDS:2 [Acaulospora morrowiae]|uniref:13322_t:CDS:1 n=1 Tax=Acaulospora morrowiae TaxID=94023 RepID=A0A9N9F6U2_9GLOM|nr:13322_t:CDS:2 [Acaulospora morrowiae]